MKRRAFSLFILLLAVFVALALTQDQWWPTYRSEIGKWGDFLQSQDSLLSTVALIVGIPYAVYRLLFRKSTETSQEIEPLHPITPQTIRARMGRGGQVNWIDRRATDVTDLRTHGRLIITGRMKLGKTRESAELIRLAVFEDLVHESRVYEPGPDFDLVGEESPHHFLDVKVSVLLFLDDLPWHFYGAGLDRLAQALATLQECKAVYVVATARTDQLTEAHQTWLERQGFHPVELRDLATEEAGRLVDAAAGVFNLQVDDAARNEFITGRDGTPEFILLGMGIN